MPGYLGPPCVSLCHTRVFLKEGVTPGEHVRVCKLVCALVRAQLKLPSVSRLGVPCLFGVSSVSAFEDRGVSPARRMCTCRNGVEPLRLTRAGLLHGVRLSRWVSWRWEGG